MKIHAEGQNHQYEEVDKTCKIILRENCTWRPSTDVELEIELERYKNSGKGKV
ncbi:MAG TPA: hypothetical protein VH481_09255 [Nitrososphaeraceae archaeon]|jgi:hypothetical protein